jgi:CubicO group peptidase (beta-lactamase class C family)
MEPVSADQLAALVREARTRWHVPAMVAAVWTPGSEAVAADGVYELGGGRHVTPATQFRVASITKPFVATLALSLVQDGLLDLDEPPPRTRARATVRQLLGNVGGLKSEWDDRPDVGEGDEALLRLAQLEPPVLPFAPGELFSYANAGFWLVGAACAAVTGATFEEAMRRRVLEPLGLAATAFEAAEPATGHEQVEPNGDEHRSVVDAYPRSRRPSGGLWSNAGDLISFARHHLGGPGPLTDESRAEMQRPLAQGPGFEYGLGWFLSRRGGGRSVEHPGSAFGFQSLLVLVPDERFAFAALTSSSRGSLAIDDVLRELGLAAQEPEPVLLTAEELAPFAGRYRAFAFEVEIAAADGGLIVTETTTNALTGAVSRAPGARARPVGEREFEIVEGDARGDRFDFPRDDLVRFAAVALRVD